MIELSPSLAAMAPGLLAIVVAAAGWSFARYTKRHAQGRAKPAE